MSSLERTAFFIIRGVVPFGENYRMQHFRGKKICSIYLLFGSAVRSIRTTCLYLNSRTNPTKFPQPVIMYKYASETITKKSIFCTSEGSFLKRGRQELFDPRRKMPRGRLNTRQAGAFWSSAENASRPPQHQKIVGSNPAGVKGF
jgi:hypothetical protein